MDNSGTIKEKCDHRIIVYKKTAGNKIETKSQSLTFLSWWEICWFVLKDIFLPSGYPDSVSSDYVEYQIWDTLQAFCSTISGTLAVQAVLESVGVGSKTATPTSAAVTWILKDGFGMIGRILFVWIQGSKFDSDCKKWRLFADILNDAALVLELYIPYHMDIATQLLCVSTTMKALVGAVGGATRAALTQHQALRNNAADVSAKDGSQETIVNLCASFLGVLVLSFVVDEKGKWTCMVTTVLLHLYFNYKAVRCLSIPLLNNERYNQVLRLYLPTGQVGHPDTINRLESVFLFHGLFTSVLCGYDIHLGYSLRKSIQDQNMTADDVNQILLAAGDRNYVVVPYKKAKAIFVTFKVGYSEEDVLKAYFHGVLLALAMHQAEHNPRVAVLRRKQAVCVASRLCEALDIENTRRPSSDELIQWVPVMVTASIVDAEFALLKSQLTKEGWNCQRQLLTVGSWTAEWN